MKITLDEGAYAPTRAHEDGFFLNCECPICGKMFHRKPYSLKIAKQKPCCSRKCLYEYKKTLMSGEGNHQYGLRGELNSSWTGGKRVNSHGYKLVYAPNHPFSDPHGYVLEHRLVAEKYLLTDDNSVEIDGKRYLKNDLSVHHINFDRMDNDPSNLVVMTRVEHKKLHVKLNPSIKDEKSGRFIRNMFRIKRVYADSEIPQRQTDGSGGFDLKAYIKEPVKIEPHKGVMIKSGLAFSIPKGYIGAIYARSGLSTREGLRPSTCVSVIDSDYRGEVGLPIFNDSDVTRTIEPGERIAQIVFHEVWQGELTVVDSLDETDRGDNGFGSSGR